MSLSIQTYVIFDTETTGLPSPGNNPRIAELCFIALSREELLSGCTEPRVVNKLSLCLNPCKAIHHMSSQISGLYNDALHCMPTFAQQANVIICFLQNLPQPACLLAHNGHNFDFPLLRSELQRANTNMMLPENIVCVDTLHAFRVFDGVPPKTEYWLKRERERKNMGVPKCQELKAPMGACSSTLLTLDVGSMTPEPVDLLYGQKRGCKYLENEIQNDTDSKCFKLVSQQNSNEVTPNRKPFNGQVQIDDKNRGEYVADVSNVRKRLFMSPDLASKSNEENEVKINSNETTQTPSTTNIALFTQDNSTSLPCNDGSTHFSSQQSVTDSELDLLEACERAEISQSTVNTKDGNKNNTFDQAKGTEIVKVKTFENEVLKGKNESPKAGATIKNDENLQSTKIRPYSLPNLYRRFFKQDPEAVHTAEGDCKTLLKLFQLKCEPMISYCDQNAVLFSEMETMY